MSERLMGIIESLKVNNVTWRFSDKGIEVYSDDEQVIRGLELSLLSTEYEKVGDKNIRIFVDYEEEPK